MRKSNKKYLELVAKLNKCSQLYHGADVSIMSDEDYDRLYRELVMMEKRDPSIIVPESPTQRVGEIPTTDLPKVQHIAKMYSLDNVFNHSDLSRFWKRFNKLRTTYGVEDIDAFYCDYKMDGLSCEIVYENGRLIRASTRGDGVCGEDVTANILTLPNSLPRYVPWVKRLVVRGEVVVHKGDFNNINSLNRAKGLNTYNNPRNYAAGSLRQKNPEITRQRKLRFYAWDIVLDVSERPQSHDKIIRMLKYFGFSTPNGRICRSIKEIEDFVMETSTLRNTLPYEIDGVVIKSNSPYGRELGWNQHAPLFNIAYKFAPSVGETTIENISWEIGRTGKLTPVATIAPLNFDGVNVTKVTLSNAEYVEFNKLGIGSKLRVCRSADVIPKVQDIIEAKGFTPLPTTCPCCGQQLIRTDSDLVCTNTSCTTRRINSLVYLLKDIIKFKGIGDKAAAELIKSGTINSLVDLFKPITSPGNISQDLLDKLVLSMRKIPLAGLISILGIPGLGLGTARKMLYEVKTLPNFIHILDNDYVAQLDIPNHIKLSLTNWYKHTESQKLLRDLVELNIPEWM